MQKEAEKPFVANPLPPADPPLKPSPVKPSKAGDTPAMVEARAREHAAILLRQEARAALTRRMGSSKEKNIQVVFIRSWKHYFPDGNSYAFSPRLNALVKGKVAYLKSNPPPAKAPAVPPSQREPLEPAFEDPKAKGKGKAKSKAKGK